MKYGFVYIWRDRKHKRYYIGSHWGTEDDGYICSSRWMRKAFRVRQNDFKRRIVSLVYTNKEDLLDEEFRWLSFIDDKEIQIKKYYNRTKHRNGHWCAKDYEKDVRKRISIATKEAMQRPEVRKNFEDGLKTRENTSANEEVRKKRSITMKETMVEKFPLENRHQKLTQEERHKYYSNKAKKIWNDRSPEDVKIIGEKISLANLGKRNRAGHKNSKEHQEAIVAGIKKRSTERWEAKKIKYKDMINETKDMKCTEVAKLTGLNRQVVSKLRKEMVQIG